MTILRDLRESTRMLFLHEVTSNRHTRLRTIADRLGMTVQGASDYAHDLEADGFLAIADGEYRATKKGIAALQEKVRELRGLVDRMGRSLAFVETTAAFAGARVRRGDRVGLFMEGGQLLAYPGRESPSTGVAGRDAERGEDLPVRQLEGIVALHPGRIVLARVPSISEGGSPAVDREKGRRLVRRAGNSVVAAVDVAGLAAARALGLKPRIEFGVVEASIDAAVRGVDVLLVVPEERAAETVEALEAANAKLEEKIAYESVNLR
jgi:putative transcriptional regulator